MKCKQITILIYMLIVYNFSYASDKVDSSFVFPAVVKVDITKAHGTGGPTFPTGDSAWLDPDSFIKYSLDLSDQTILASEVAKLKMMGFNKIKVGLKAEALTSASSISKGELLEALHGIKVEAIEPNGKSLFQDYEHRVRAGLIDLVFVTDDEEKVIFMDSTKIKK